MKKEDITHLLLFFNLVKYEEALKIQEESKKLSDIGRCKYLNKYFCKLQLWNDGCKNVVHTRSRSFDVVDIEDSDYKMVLYGTAKQVYYCTAFVGFYLKKNVEERLEEFIEKEIELFEQQGFSPDLIDFNYGSWYQLYKECRSYNEFVEQLITTGCERKSRDVKAYIFYDKYKKQLFNGEIEPISFFDYERLYK